MRSLKLLVILTPILVLGGCGAKEFSQEDRKTQEPTVAVNGAKVEWTSIPSTYEASGTVRARVSATVSAKVMGYAKEVRAQVGDQVKEGATLVLIDPRDQEASIREAEAVRDTVKSAIPEAESAITAAKSQLDLAQVTFERMQTLLDKRSVTQQEYDESSARLKAAQASLAMARARRTELDSKLAQSEQVVRSAGIQRAYTTISAPFSGVILTKSVEPGTLVMPGAPLFTVERGGIFRLEANVEESRLPEIRIGQTAAVTIDARSVEGRVSEIVPAVDAASRTGIVKIDLPALANLRSGEYGRASFGGEKRDALTIPKNAVVERGSLQSMFVVDKGVARLRLVTLGAQMDDRIEVLSGLSEGETVVSPVLPAVTDGVALEVRR